MNPWPIFSEPWWLDATAGPGNWGECRVEHEGTLLARLPYVKKRRLGTLTLGQPALTQCLGPWFRSPDPQTKQAQRLAKEKDLTGELLRQLPRHGCFVQHFSPDVLNWLPWYWHGFSQTTRYTYRLDLEQSEQELWSGLSENIRREIRKSANKSVSVSGNASLGEFAPLWEKTFARQGKRPPVSEAFLQRLDETCAARQARKIFVAYDGAGRPHAGVYLVWNNYAAYYLMGGGDPELRNSGATSLAMWEAIRFARSVTKVFDFEGSMIEPVERFFRAFGAAQTPYFRVSKCFNPLLCLLVQAKQMAGCFRRGKQ